MANLLEEILERIEYERLIEEGKDPVEVLHYKFKNVPSNIIDSIIAIDPTKKKTYSQWALSKWDNEKYDILSGLDSGRLAKLFQHYKSHSDIQIKDCPSVWEGLRKFVPVEDTVLVKSSKPTTVLMNDGWSKEVDSELANDFDIVFKKDNWIIAVPNTYEADCKLGENMKWCTAGGRTDFERGRYYYNEYINDYGGKYYVNFDMSTGESRLGKDYPFTRYQFHFETNQFMDKEDDPVGIDNIGMPESAEKFYLDEGYDINEYLEEDIETRMERYNEQRYHSEYRLNDDLYLNIEYDGDYAYVEPNDDTDFYLFSVNDDRDPVSYEAVSNPHVNDDVVILSSDNMCVLKTKYSKSEQGAIVATCEGWGSYNACEVDNYLVVDGSSIFCITDSGSVLFVNENGDKDECKMDIDDCKKIFINSQCTKADMQKYGMLFVEVVADGGHSLFSISKEGNLNTVVARDIPVNGDFYYLNKNGYVEGEYRYYRVYEPEDYDDEEEDFDYEFERKLPTGDFLVKRPISSTYYNSFEYNIVKSDTRQLLISEWFNKFICSSKNFYAVAVSKKKKCALFNISDGHQVGVWYDSLKGLDKERDIIYGVISGSDTAQVDLLDGFKGKCIASFGSIISLKPANNKIVVLSKDKTTSKVFDYVTGKICFPELCDFKYISTYECPYIYLCGFEGKEEKAIFDLGSMGIVARNLSDANRLNSYFMKLDKLNGKANILDTRTKKELFQEDVDDITSLNEYTNVVVFVKNGKYYPMNYNTNKLLINPNGISLPTDCRFSDKICCSGENYNMFFEKVDNSDDFVFSHWRNKYDLNEYGREFKVGETPDEVIQMYKLIFGQQESVKKGFMSLIRRIDEATRLYYNNIID